MESWLSFSLAGWVAAGLAKGTDHSMQIGFRSGLLSAIFDGVVKTLQLLRRSLRLPACLAFGAFCLVISFGDFLRGHYFCLAHGQS